MLIPSDPAALPLSFASLSRRVNANSQHDMGRGNVYRKLIKKGEC